MKIGYACTPITTNARTNRKLLLKDFSYEKFCEITKKNLDDLEKILKWNIKNNIYLFRISSDIIPLGSHEINNIKWEEIFKERLNSLGKIICNNNLRVSMHPGQYTVLNSPNEDVLRKSIRDLEYHCKFLDSLNLDYKNKIIIHIGGVYGNKPLATKNFLKGFNLLSSFLKRRLVIENDEKNFSLDDVLYISNKINIPVIFDNLHNLCYGDNKYSLREIYSKVSKSWNYEIDGPIKVHYSQQDLLKKKGSHSPTIEVKSFLDYYETIKDFSPDIMLEVKDKDISAIKCINAIKELNKELTPFKIKEEKENYEILFKEYFESFNENPSILHKSLREYYFSLDKALLCKKKHKNLSLSIPLAKEELKPYINSRENTYLEKLISKGELLKAKSYIKKLVKRIEFPKKKLSYYISQY